MKFERFFTSDGASDYDGIKFKSTSSEIKNPDGTIVFSAPSIEVPSNYSQVAADVIAQNSQVKGQPLPLSTRPKGRYPLFAYKSLLGVTCSNSFWK